MSHVGTYQPWSHTWVHTCAGCGQGFQVSDPFSRLVASAVVRLSATKAFVLRESSLRPRQQVLRNRRASTKVSSNRSVTIIEFTVRGEVGGHVRG